MSQEQQTLRKQVLSEMRIRGLVVNTLLVLTLLYIVFHLTFTDMGLLHYMQLSETRESLRGEVAAMESKNNELITSINDFKDNFYVEKNVREDFGMSAPGEMIFMYEDEAGGR